YPSFVRNPVSTRPPLFQSFFQFAPTQSNSRARTFILLRHTEARYATLFWIKKVMVLLCNRKRGPVLRWDNFFACEIPYCHEEVLCCRDVVLWCFFWFVRSTKPVSGITRYRPIADRYRQGRIRCTPHFCEDRPGSRLRVGVGARGR